MIAWNVHPGLHNMLLSVWSGMVIWIIMMMVVLGSLYPRTTSDIKCLCNCSYLVLKLWFGSPSLSGSVVTHTICLVLTSHWKRERLLLNPILKLGIGKIILLELIIGFSGVYKLKLYSLHKIWSALYE